MIVAVVTVAVPSYPLGQPAAPSTLIDSSSQAGRGGLGRHCNEAERKGHRDLPKGATSFSSSISTCLGVIPRQLCSVGSCQSYGG